MADQCVCCGRQRVRLAFDDQRKIEQVSGRCSMPAMEHFLGDDFRRRFHAYAPAIDRPFLPGVIEKIGSCDEIHLAFLELQLDPCAGIFAVVAGKARGHIAQAGSDEAQVLGVRHEDVDVLAEPVPMSKHQYRSATQRPERIGDAAVAPDLPDEDKRPG